MDDQALIAEISVRQATATESDQASDTRDQPNPRPIAETLEAKLQRIREFKIQERTYRSETAEEREAADRSKRLTAIGDIVSAAGQRYLNASVNSWQATTERQRHVRASIIDYCRTIDDHVGAGEGVVLYGPVGTGKDHLAVGIARAACLADLDCKWLKGQEWFGQLRDAIESDRTERELFRSLECDVLILSDPLPPMGPLTPYQASMLYRLTEDRYSRGGVIVATVNVADDAEADSRLGAQTWDRLCDRAWKVKCDWPSFRKPARVV